jgi:hypothetical protein
MLLEQSLMGLTQRLRENTLPKRRNQSLELGLRQQDKCFALCRLEFPWLC